MAEKGKRVPTKDTGVYALTSSVRKHSGKPDVCYYITYKGESKRKIWEKIGWRSEHVSQAYAKEQRQKRMVAKADGIPIDTKTRKLTFEAAYRKWEELVLSALKEQKSVTFWAEEHILPAFGKRSMANITALDLEQFKKDLFQKKLAPQTVKHILGIIRRVYRKATAWGIYYGPIPTMAIAMPRVDAERLRFLTRDEAAALLAELQKTSLLWHDIALLSLYSGIREGDIFALRARQINFADGYIDLVDSKSGTKHAYFPENVREMLLSRVGEDKSALIFPSPKNGGVIWNTGKPFHNAVKECKFNVGVTDRRFKVVFHTLRHTFASWLAENDVSIQKIADLMNHASVRTTQRYAKLSRKSLRGAIDNINPAPKASGSEKESSE